MPRPSGQIMPVSWEVFPTLLVVSNAIERSPTFLMSVYWRQLCPRDTCRESAAMCLASRSNFIVWISKTVEFVEWFCHGNFGPAEILVRGTKISRKTAGKIGPVALALALAANSSP